jgi:TPR repeat protein
MELQEAAEKHGFAPARTRLGELQLEAASSPGTAPPSYFSCCINCKELQQLKFINSDAIICAAATPEEDRAILTESAISHFEQAAALGDPRAAVRLGFMFFKGEHGRPKDLETAKTFFAQAKRLNPQLANDPEIPSTRQIDELIEQKQKLILKRKEGPLGGASLLKVKFGVLR